MPPKTKYTKEQITDAAFGIVRAGGMSALSARSLANALHTSTAPLFTVFDSIGEIRDEVIKKAKTLYTDYLREGLGQTVPFKGAGMKYIEFAKDEPELFKLLFMSGNGSETITHFLPEFDENSPTVLEALKDSRGIDSEKARRLYNHMSVYAYGFASLFAQGINIFTMDDIARMMSEVFTAMMKYGEET